MEEGGRAKNEGGLPSNYQSEVLVRLSMGKALRTATATRRLTITTAICVDSAQYGFSATEALGDI